MRRPEYQKSIHSRLSDKSDLIIGRIHTDLFQCAGLIPDSTMVHVHNSKHLVISYLTLNDIKRSVSLISVSAPANEINPSIEVITKIFESKPLQIFFHIIKIQDSFIAVFCKTSLAPGPFFCLFFHRCDVKATAKIQIPIGMINIRMIDNHI